MIKIMYAEAALAFVISFVGEQIPAQAINDGTAIRLQEHQLLYLAMMPILFGGVTKVEIGKCCLGRPVMAATLLEIKSILVIQKAVYHIIQK